MKETLSLHTFNKLVISISCIYINFENLINDKTMSFPMADTPIFNLTKAAKDIQSRVYNDF